MQRLYWLQFESYVASKPTLHYQYDSPAHTKLNGLDFYVDIYARPSELRVGSDREHVERLLSRAGLSATLYGSAKMLRTKAAIRGQRMRKSLGPDRRKVNRPRAQVKGDCLL